MVSILGNSPSSGSTYLADLLDSTPTTACGTELNLFSNRLIYEDFSKFKQVYKKNFPLSSIYTSGMFNYDRLHNYGLSDEEFKQMLVKSESFEDFIGFFKTKYFSLRGKNLEKSIWFEKTPQNINSIKEFLDSVEDGFFVSIVRNPMYVYTSLLKRGFTNYMALNTWLIDISRLYKYREHPRVIIIKYEELVENPYEITSKLIHNISNVSYTPQEIEVNYLNNNFRKYYSKKLVSWTVREYGEKRSANDKSFCSGHIKELARLRHTKISSGYADIYDLATVDFMEALEYFGYLENYNDTTKGFNAEKMNMTVSDYKIMILKYLNEYSYTKVNFKKLFAYREPIGES